MRVLSYDWNFYEINRSKNIILLLYRESIWTRWKLDRCNFNQKLFIGIRNSHIWWRAACNFLLLSVICIFVSSRFGFSAGFTKNVREFCAWFVKKKMVPKKEKDRWEFSRFNLFYFFIWVSKIIHPLCAFIFCSLFLFMLC